MTPHSVTGTPNMAMLGQEVLRPASLIVQPPEEPVVVTTSFAADFPPEHAQRACVRSQRDQRRCEDSKELFRQARQGTILRAKSVSVALLATTFVAQ